MKKSMIKIQFIAKMALFLGVIAVIILLLGYYFIKTKMEDNQAEQINYTTSLVVNSMESTQKSADTIEHMIEKKLYAASKGIMADLREKKVEEIGMGELKQLAKAWDVHEISLWQRVGDDIVITQSSDVTQLNMSSKRWGYWFTAFDQLLSGQEVTVEEGYAMENYWVGPISRAERFDHIYYKFAYYYDGTTDFMINPFIEDEEIYRQTFRAGPTQMIEKIIEETLDIQEIAVINVAAWLKGEENDVVEPHTDLPILYGSHQIEHEKDEQLLQLVQSEKRSETVYFERNGVPYKKSYISLPDDRVMVITHDLTRKKQATNQFLVGFIVSYLVVSVMIFFIIQWVADRQLRPIEKNVQHIQGMAKGDLTQRLTINEKNELDWLADQINEMTKNFHRLITGVKEETHSLVMVSNLLSNQVYSSIKTMGETSTTMTAESKHILLEISISLEKLQHLTQLLQQQKQVMVGSDPDLNPKNRLLFPQLLSETNEKLNVLEQMITEHSTHVTDITLMFYDTLQELNQALKRMDQLATKLNQKVEFFKVKDEL